MFIEDVQRCSSAFINLLRNATQVRAGKGEVWVSALRDDAGGLHTDQRTREGVTLDRDQLAAWIGAPDRIGWLKSWIERPMLRAAGD